MLARGTHAATSVEAMERTQAAADLVVWLFERGVTNEAAVKAAGVSKKWLDGRHADTGTSRADLFREKAMFGGKSFGRRRGDRTGLPLVAELPFSKCCTKDCGRYVTAPCYEFHWELFKAAE